MESLHEHVPKDILPEELGGNMGPFDNHDCAQAVFAIEHHFARMQDYFLANESLLKE